MRLLVSIGTSLICGTAVAAVLYRYIQEYAATAAFWQTDPVAAAWSAYGGAGGILVLCYLAFAFVLVTSYAYLDLATARARLDDAAVTPAELPERQWRHAFANTDFASFAAQLTPYELAAAPLSLLRLLRTELWRVYAKRLLCVSILAVALAGAVAVVGIAPVPALPPPAATARWQEAAVVLALVAATAAWLAMDNAVGRLARMMTQASAEWTDTQSVTAERPDPWLGMAPLSAGASTGDLVAAVERLVAALAQRPPGAADPNAGAAAATDRLNAVLSEAAHEQRQAIERLGEQLAEQGSAVTQHAETAQSAHDDTVALAAAMAQLAAAVDKLADPVLQRMQFLGATDRRLLAVLERQETVVGSINARWNQLAAALHAMSAGLGSVAQAAASAETAADAHLVPAPSPTELGDELQELLDDISTKATASVPHAAT